MTDRQELVQQTRLAFEFVHKLYLEVSYLIKEIEGQVLQEEERFVICRPTGYAVSAMRSTGLEPGNVNLWLLRKMAVAFIPEEDTTTEGYTNTSLDQDLCVLYLRIVLDDRTADEPYLYFGVLHGIRKKPKAPWNKFESIMGHIEYYDHKVFKSPDKIDYEDTYVQFQGELFMTNLFDVTNSEELRRRVIEPALALYRQNEGGTPLTSSTAGP